MSNRKPKPEPVIVAANPGWYTFTALEGEQFELLEVIAWRIDELGVTAITIVDSLDGPFDYWAVVDPSNKFTWGDHPPLEVDDLIKVIEEIEARKSARTANSQKTATTTGEPK